jgi:hypothetical protein
MQRDSFLSDDCPPMGIYETLYAFRDAFGQFMGTQGTHPWSQGFPHNFVMVVLGNQLYNDAFSNISFIIFSNLIAVTYSPNNLLIQEKTVSTIHLCP